MRLEARTRTSREAALRHRRRAGQRGRRVAAALVIAVVCTTAAYVGLDSWNKWHAPVPASSDRATAPEPASAAAVPAPPGRSAQGKVTPAPTAAGITTQVAKCVVNGATSYSDAGCPSDARASMLTVDARDNLASGLPADVRRQVLAAPAQAVPPAQPAVSIAGAPDRRFLCAALDEQVKAIDAAARQPRSAAEQDRLAADRRNARDRQFRLGC